MSSRTSMLPILLLPLGLTLTACEEKATDADMVALMERVAVLESQVGDVPTGDGDALSDRVTALEDDMGDAQESLVAANTLISENQIGVALNEEAILDVEEDLALTEGDIVENATAISENVTAIAEANAAIAGLQEQLGLIEADITALADEVGDNADEIAALQAAYGNVLTQITDIEMSISSIDLTAITALVDGVSEDLADMEADLTADMADIEAEVADLDGRGEVWYETGSGTGTCARATVTTTSDRPLMVFATVEASASGYDGCYSSTSWTGCYDSSTTMPSVSSLGDSGTVTVDAQDSTGAFTFSESRTEQALYSYRPGYYLLPTGSYPAYQIYETGYLSVAQDWTIPLNTVLDIPSAGVYTIDLDVTGFSGNCTLMVVQP